MKEVYVQSNKHQHCFNYALWPSSHGLILLDILHGRTGKKRLKLSLNPIQTLSCLSDIEEVTFLPYLHLEIRNLVHTL